MWTRLLHFLAFVAVGTSLLGLGAGLLGIAVSILKPSLQMNTLYVAFRSPNALGFSCLLGAGCYIGTCQFLLSRAKTVRKAFNSYPSKFGRRVGVIGVILLGVMFIVGFQYVLQKDGEWQFDSKAGSVTVSESQARQQLWRNLRWESLLLLNVVNLVGLTAFDLLRVIRAPQANGVHERKGYSS